MPGHSVKDNEFHLADSSVSWQGKVITDPPEVVNTDVCIIGAGVAGSALAACLGRSGIDTVLVERDFSEPDKFIGELLQPGGVQMLRELEMDEVLHDIDAQEVVGYALFDRDRHFSVQYPVDKSGLRTGRGFRYGKFVMNLRNAASAQESVQMIESAAKALVKDKSGNVTGVELQSRNRTRTQVNAHLTILVEGAFSRLRAEVSKTQPKQHITSFMVGLLLEDARLPYPGHGHVFMTRSSPFLVYPVTSRESRVLIDFQGDRSPKTSTRLAARFDEVASNLPEELQGAFRIAIEEPTVRAMPGHLLPARPDHGAGVVLLGDALNMRHPLTGGGMTVALSDVRYLADKIINRQVVRNHRSVVNEFYYRRHRFDGSINILADALYAVMSDSRLGPACFDYLSQGERYSSDPVRILSGVSRDTNLLIRKFASVAAFAAREEMNPFRGIESLRGAHDTLTRAANIVRPLIHNENPPLLTRMLLKSSQILLPACRDSQKHD